MKSEKAGFLCNHQVTASSLFAALFLWCAEEIHGGQIRVPADHPTIQQAINYAADGDTILVAPGTYNESIDFSNKDIAVVSSGGPAVTSITGQQIAPVVRITALSGSTSLNTRLQGFTIQNGNRGVYVGGASATVIGNLIVSNITCQGPAVDVEFCSAIIISNIIANNYVAGCSSGASGGGMLVGGNGATQVIHNIITNNSPGGIFVNAAGTPAFKDNVIGWNTGSLTSWGGMELGNHSDALIENNLIVSNIGIGLMFVVPSGYRGPYIINNTIAFNRGATVSGIYADGFDQNTLIANNIVVADGLTAMYTGNFSSSVPLMQFNDFYSSGLSFSGYGSNPIGTNGNVSVDPSFFDPTFADYHLLSVSPLIDIGESTNAPTEDIEGTVRPYDGNGDGISAIDLGAYEWIPRAPSPPRVFSGISVSWQNLLSWRASPEAALYNLMRATSAGGPYTLLQSSSATNFVDSAVISNVVYYYVVNASNNVGQSSNSFEISVRAGNLPPMAVNDSVTTPEDTPTNISVLANDSDPNNDPLTIVSFTQPPRGKVTTNGLTLLYTPTTNFNGTNIFSYVISDGRSAFSTGQVTVVVTPVNDAPISSNAFVVLNADSPGITIIPHAFDPEGDPVSFIFVTLPTKGIFDVNTYEYRPAHAYVGSDFLTFQATDGQATGNLATITFVMRAETDTNHDGIPDSWASQYGITNRDADDDSDGFTNFQEYLANTNPLDSTSLLQITSVSTGTNGFLRISWAAIGSTRYRVQYRDSLSGGSFIDIVRSVSEEMNASLDGMPSMMTFTDTNFPSSSGLRLYRIKTVTQ